MAISWTEMLEQDEERKRQTRDRTLAAVNKQAVLKNRKKPSSTISWTEMLDQPDDAHPEAMSHERGLQKIRPSAESRQQVLLRKISDTAGYTWDTLGKTWKRSVFDLAAASVSGKDALRNAGQNAMMTFLYYADREKYRALANDPDLMDQFVRGVRTRVQQEVGLHGKAGFGDTPAERDQTARSVAAWRKRSNIEAPYSKAVQAAELSGDWYREPKFFFEKGLDVALQLAEMVGLNAILPGSGYTLMAAQQGGSAKAEAYERLRQRGVNTTEAHMKATGEGIINSMSAMVAERIPGRVFSKMPDLETMITNKTARRLAALGLPAVAEGIEESIDSTTQDVARYIVEQDPEAFRGYFDRLAQSALLGGMGGGMIGTAGAVGRGMQRGTSQQQELTRQLMNIVATGQTKGLVDLSEKSSPSRKDFEVAGFDVKRLKLTAEQRKMVAGALTPARLDNMVKDISEELRTESSEEKSAQEFAKKKLDEWAAVQPSEPVDQLATTRPSGPPAEATSRDTKQLIAQARGEARDTADRTQAMKEVHSLPPASSLASPDDTPNRAGEHHTLMADDVRRVLQEHQQAGPREPLTINDLVSKLNRWQPDDVMKGLEAMQGAGVLKLGSGAPSSQSDVIIGGRRFTTVEAVAGPTTESQPPPKPPMPSGKDDLPTRTPEVKTKILTTDPAGKSDPLTVVPRKPTEAEVDPRIELEAELRKLPPELGTEVRDAVLNLEPGQDASFQHRRKAIDVIKGQDGTATVMIRGKVFEIPASPEVQSIRPQDRSQVPEKPRDLMPDIATGEAGTFDLQKVVEAITGSGDPVNPTTGTTNLLVTPRIVKRLKRGLKRALASFTSAGPLPNAMYESHNQQQYEMQYYEERTAQVLHDYHAAIKKAYDLGIYENLSREEAFKIDQAIKGQRRLDEFAEPVRKAITDFRLLIDSLTREALRSGAIGGKLEGSVYNTDEMYDILRQSIKDGASRGDVEDFLMAQGMSKDNAALVATVLNNEGFYVTRGYQAFGGKDWHEKIPQPVWNRMHNYVRENVKKAEDWSDEEIDRYMGDLLAEARNAGGMMEMLSSPSVFSINRDILKHRLDLPVEYRDFLGEVLDPEANVAHTIASLASLVTKYKMADRIEEAGLGTFIWRRNDLNRPQDANHVIKVAGRELMTTEDVHDAFQTSMEVKEVSTVFQAWRMFEAASQITKTALSPMSHARQIPGNFMLMMANGNSPHHIVQALRTVFPALTHGGSEANRDYFNRGTELGLSQKGVEFNIWSDYLRSPDFQAAIDEISQGRGVNAMKSLMNVLYNAPKELYGYEDTIFKFASWEAEKARYRKAYPDWTESQVEEHAAAIVLDTMPNYAKLIKLFRDARRLPLGVFTAFPSEVIRTNINGTMLGIREIRSGNPALMAAGMKRLFSRAAVTSAAYTFGEMTRMWFGRTGEDDEAARKHYDPAVRKLVAPWVANSPFAYLPRTAPSKVRYIHMGYTDPNSYLTESIWRVIREVRNPAATTESMREALLDGAMMYFDPYVQPKIGLTSFFQAFVNNLDEYQRPISDKSDSTLDKLRLRMRHFYEQTLEPGFVKSQKRIAAGKRREVSPGGKAYNSWEELGAMLTGVKVEELDVRTSLEFDMGDFSDSVREAGRQVRKYFGRQGAEPAMKQETVQRVGNIHQNAQRSLREQINAALVTDPTLTREDLYQMGKKRRVSQESIDDVLQGRTRHYIPDDIPSALEMKSLVGPEWAAEIDQEIKSRKGNMVYTATGPTSTGESAQKAQDAWKQLRGLGVGKSEAFNLLYNDLLRRDQESYRRAAAKVLDPKAKISDKIRARQRLARGAPTTPALTAERRRRFDKLGFTADELSRLLQARGVR